MKFILEYYRKEHPELTVNASQIFWQLDSDSSDMLPVMQTDLMLSREEKVLIIDAKYYEHPQRKPRASGFPFSSTCQYLHEEASRGWF